MKRILYTLSCILLLASCKVAGSKQDQQAAKKIADFWGGKCTYGITTSFSTEKGNRKTYNLKLEGSPSFKGDIPPEIIASNMALTVYNSWQAGEKEKYTYINVTLQKGNDETKQKSYEYTIQQLRTVVKEMPLFDLCANDLKAHKVENIFQHVDPSLYADSQAVSYRQDVAGVDSLCGTIKGQQLLAFNFIEIEEDGKKVPLLKLSGLLKGTKEDVRFSIYVDTQKKAGEYFLYGTTFKF